MLVGFLEPLSPTPRASARLAERGVVAFAMESIPRITRAQSMDALSSQATVAGYKAALIGAERLPKFFPLLMTAAGTVAPAKVLVVGAGVAGLQAIATARRLGRGRVRLRRATGREASRSRASAQRSSTSGIRGEETEGGYARELSEEEQRAQQDALEQRLPEFDVVITTALVPGRPGAAPDPRRPRSRRWTAGSVIVDLAAEAGGNCELTEPGEEVVREGVTIIGADEPAEHDGEPREPALLAQRHRAAAPPRSGGRADARLRRRDHGRRVRDPARGGAGIETAQFITELTVLVLAIFLGFEVISKVPTMLHTPLMSGTNAIHGIVIVGAIVVAGRPDADTFTKRGRLLRRRARDRQRGRRLRRHRPHAGDVQGPRSRVGENASNLLYLVTIVTFILALRFLSSPRRARLGN